MSYYAMSRNNLTTKRPSYLCRHAVILMFASFGYLLFMIHAIDKKQYFQALVVSFLVFQDFNNVFFI